MVKKTIKIHKIENLTKLNLVILPSKILKNLWGSLDDKENKPLGCTFPHSLSHGTGTELNILQNKRLHNYLKNRKINQEKIRGGILFITTLLLPLLIGFVLIVINSWSIYLVKNEMNIAADAAALAAATSLRTLAPKDPDKAVKLAYSIASANRFTNGKDQTKVKVMIPPGNSEERSSSYHDNAEFARVEISRVVKIYYGDFFGIPTMTVRASVVAGPDSFSPVIITLSHSESESLKITGGTTVNASGFSVGVNSNSSNALSMSGNSSIIAAQVNIVGEFKMQGVINAKIQAHAGPTADPFANLQLPQASYGCSNSNFNYSKNEKITLYPGVYCGGISLSGNGTVEFSPGTYILMGGGLKIRENVNVYGNHLVFYNTGNTSGASQFGPYKITTSGTVTLSAPTVGPLAGMLMVQDSKNPLSAKISLNVNQIYQGNLYLPSCQLEINARGKSPQTLGICVARSINIKGGGEISFSSKYTNSSDKGKVVLFE